MMVRQCVNWPGYLYFSCVGNQSVASNKPISVKQLEKNIETNELHQEIKELRNVIKFFTSSLKSDMAALYALVPVCTTDSKKFMTERFHYFREKYDALCSQIGFWFLNHGHVEIFQTLQEISDLRLDDAFFASINKLLNWNIEELIK